MTVQGNSAAPSGERKAVRARDTKAVDKQRSFQANLFGNLFFKHLAKAKSSLDRDKDKVSLIQTC